VTRSFPDTVVIAVQQRIPVMAVAVTTGYLLIDEYGVTVTSAEAKPPGLPLLAGPPPPPGSGTVRAAALVVRGLPAWLRARVSSVSDAPSVTLQLSGGITVIWGGPGLAAEKAAEVQVLLAGGARVVDVSDPATAVTR
jgi:cell division protein FtsQ